MKLPLEFTARMQRLLGEEYDEFMASFELPRYYGLRVNTLKIPIEEFLDKSPFPLEPVPWTKDGFYFPEGERPAKHPYYFAGLYYLQEPSAMAPGAILDARPGDRILDLCAAPGGKSTQVAAALKGEGILVANDNHPERVKALAKNLELFGVRNAVITNETPDRLARTFKGFFDKIIIDAPCSGEGMFRKDEDAAKSWGTHSVEKCSVMQRDILDQAAEMLKPGGEIVYSTCTFAPEENEGSMARFIERFPEFELVDIPKVHGLAPGRPDWSGLDLEYAKPVRLWPHRMKGEGHFVAKLHRREESIQVNDSLEVPVSVKDTKAKKNIKPKNGSPSRSTDNGLSDFYEFITCNLNIEIKGHYELYGDHLYLQPEGLPDLKGLKVVRPGWYLGMLKKNRFEPGQALALGLKAGEAQRVLDLASDNPSVISYLKGETLEYEGSRGWTLVCVDGYPLGWGKQSNDVLKNYYPKGWRWLD